MECPNCHAKLLWSYPTPEIMERLEQGKLGDIVLCSCVINEKNYCPVCGALVWESKIAP